MSVLSDIRSNHYNQTKNIEFNGQGSFGKFRGYALKDWHVRLAKKIRTEVTVSPVADY